MKKLFIVLTAVFIFCSTATAAFGADMPSFNVDDELEKLGAGELLQNLPEEAEEFTQALPQEKTISELLALSPADFFTAVKGMAGEALKKPLKIMFSITGIIMVCAVVGALKESIGGDELTKIFNLVATLAVVAVVVPTVVDCLKSAGKTITSFATFLLTYIPILTGIIASSGKPITASTYNMVVFAGCEFAAQFIVETVLPVLAAYLALCIVGSLTTVVDMQSITGAIKSAVTWVMGLMLSLFIGLITVQSVVASSGDSVTTKAAKFIIGSAVPVAGSAISDAFMAAQGCINLLKSTFGGFGVLIAAVTFLPIILRVAGLYIALNLSGAIAESMGVSQVAKLLKSVTSAFAILLTVVLTFSLLVIITTAIMLLVGGA